MSAIRFQSKSPRHKRDVAALLEAIPYETKEDKQKVVALCLEHYVEAKRALNVFGKLLVEGMEYNNPELILAAVQAYRDEMAAMLAGRDEYIARTMESKSTVVTERIANQMTEGGFGRIADTGNTFTDTDVRRALADRLRDVADEAIKSFDTVTDAENADIQQFIAEITEPTPTDHGGPKV
ncbi:hypothetical protein [Rhizobium sp. BK176]|uniref:hypothetical protein n=1 Tax=Rhizobium sp. BK176 TaxID=2587071 RepID=UPI002168F70D|nr:hypothetical protein [Rhizobium sp. BK176]MCS4089030.1 uncharacterized protein YaiI (UPF0178 family) [Rhizobium sp. BK176]